MSDVTPSARALARVRDLAAAQRDDLAEPVPQRLLEAVRSRAQLTINFHPDRPAADGRTAARALADDGIYRTQFETGTSAGGLDSVVNGARSRWEHRMFAGAYDDASPAQRPRYAGLDLVGYGDGACPRFGSCHLRLRSHLLDRTTMTWGDSASEPLVVGVWGIMDAVLAAANAAGWPEASGRQQQDGRLDRYVEAQVHHQVAVASDVQTVVADPAFRGQPAGRDLERLALRHGVALEWHAGYVLEPDALDPDFRTEASPVLAQDLHDRLARPGQLLDAELLGRGVQAVLADPVAWSVYGDQARVLQELKYLWHHLVARGHPSSA